MAQPAGRGVGKEGREQIYKLTNEIKSIFGFRELQISAATNRNSLHLNIDGRTFSFRT